MRFKLNGLDNVKLSQNSRLCIESIHVPILYDVNQLPKTYGLYIIKMSNLSSINCYDSHGKGQCDPVIFTSPLCISQQRVYDTDNKNSPSTLNTTAPQVFYNPNPNAVPGLVADVDVYIEPTGCKAWNAAWTKAVVAI